MEPILEMYPEQLYEEYHEGFTDLYGNENFNDCIMSISFSFKPKMNWVKYMENDTVREGICRLLAQHDALSYFKSQYQNLIMQMNGKSKCFMDFANMVHDSSMVDEDGNIKNYNEVFKKVNKAFAKWQYDNGYHNKMLDILYDLQILCATSETEYVCTRFNNQRNKIKAALGKIDNGDLSTLDDITVEDVFSLEEVDNIVIPTNFGTTWIIHDVDRFLHDEEPYDRTFICSRYNSLMDIMKISKKGTKHVNTTKQQNKQSGKRLL
jgi:hypothetical protein